MIRAVFLDIDGTLLSHRTNCVPESTWRAMRMLKEKGAMTVLCTGRHTSELEELKLLDFPYDAYVLLNGQFCLDDKMNVIASFPFEADAKKALLEVFHEKKIPLVLIEKERMYISFVNDYVVEAQAAVHTNVPPVEEYLGDDFYMCVGYFNGDRTIYNIPGLKVTEWYSGAQDIIPENASKAKGMQVLLEHYGISRDEIIAFGDGDNDVEMLAFAGIGVAMGNGTAAVKKAADYITDDIDEGGIYNALVHFGVIE